MPSGEGQHSLLGDSEVDEYVGVEDEVFSAGQQANQPRMRKAHASHSGGARESPSLGKG
jgi:hypothetical protein